MSEFSNSTDSDARFLNNVTIDKQLKLQADNAIISSWLDSRFAAAASVAQNAVDAEASARASQDVTLQDNINAVSSTVNTNKAEFDAYVASNDQALAHEASARVTRDDEIAGDLTDFIDVTFHAYQTNATAALNAETAARQLADTNEATARANADNALQVSVDANNALIASEKADLRNELLYGGDQSNPADDKLHRVAERLAVVEAATDAFNPTAIDDRVASLITQHDSDNANQNSRISKLEEYFDIDESDPSNVVITIKSGAKLKVLGDFEQGE